MNIKNSGLMVIVTVVVIFNLDVKMTGLVVFMRMWKVGVVMF